MSQTLNETKLRADNEGLAHLLLVRRNSRVVLGMLNQPQHYNHLLNTLQPPPPSKGGQNSSDPH